MIAVLSLLERLAEADPAGCAAPADVADLVHDVQGVRAWLDAFEARCAARAAALGRSAAEVLGDGGRRRSRDASVAAARAEVCVSMPAFHAALAAAAVSAAHVDAVARAAAELSESERSALVELAPSLVTSAVSAPTVERFERECRDVVRLLSVDEGESRLDALRRQRRVKRWVDHRSGMHHTMLALDPEADGRVAAALHAATIDHRAGLADPHVSWDHVQADALVGLITGARSLDRRVPEVSVLIDLPTLEAGLHDRSVSETSAGVALPPETIRRMACTADIVPVVLGGAGEVLDVGRSRRLATDSQRRAIAAMHTTCVMPGCTVPVDRCRIHHVDPWHHGGRTDLDQLVPVCERDHHRFHEGGWTLKLAPDRTITIVRPDGTVVHDGASVDRTRRPPGRAPTD